MKRPLLCLFTGLTALGGSAAWMRADDAPAAKQERMRYQVRVQSGSKGDPSREEILVATKSAQNALAGIEAWMLRDADLFLKDIGAEFSYRRPDGRVVTRADLEPDLKRRMAMTRSIDYMGVTIEVESIDAKKAIVLSHQEFSRVLLLPEGRERRRITGVTHREVWEKTRKGWQSKGGTEENQTARWEDEHPAGR